MQPHIFHLTTTSETCPCWKFTICGKRKNQIQCYLIDSLITSHGYVLAHIISWLLWLEMRMSLYFFWVDIVLCVQYDSHLTKWLFISHSPFLGCHNASCTSQFTSKPTIYKLPLFYSCYNVVTFIWGKEIIFPSFL